MLITYDQFELRQAVRTSAHLFTPRTIAQDSIQLPQNSFIHLLNLSDDKQFPERDMVYLNGVPDNKRVPVFHIAELTTKTEVQMLQDRFVEKKTRVWQREHMQQFRAWPLLEVPNPDRQTNAVINYNLLKDLYKYKSTFTAPLSRYQDIMGTYWSTIAQCATKDPSVHHFATIAIPNAIPSRAIVNKIIEISPARYARVVTSNELNGVIQLYKYLNPATRHLSTMAGIDETVSDRITLEFTYEGYSVFCRLSHLVSLHKDSTLDNKLKLPTERLHQVFLLMILKIQNAVLQKTQGSDPLLQLQDQVDEQDAQTDVNNDAQMDSDSDEDPQPAAPELTDAQRSEIEKQTLGVKVSKADALQKLGPTKDLPELDTSYAFDDGSLNEKSVGTLLDKELGELEGDSDDLFIHTVASVTKDTPETETVEEVEDTTHQVDYSDDNIEQTLKDPTPQERFEAYIQEAKSFDAISTAEVRSLRKTFEQRKALKSPYEEKSIDEYKVVTPQDLELPDTTIPIDNDLVQDHLKHEFLFNADKKYIQKTMRKHIVACVTALERNDLIIKDYQVEEVAQSTGKYEVHKLSIKPLKGKESQVYFRIPVINDEGEFTAGGVTYRMRKQKSSAVLAKMSPIKVGVSSNYNKLFISRTELKAFDPYSNIAEQIKTDYLDNKGNISKIAPGNRFDNQQRFPNIYAALSQHFNDVTTPTHRFFFNYKEAPNYVDEKTLKDLQAKELLFIGYDSKKHILVMDKGEGIFDYSDGMKSQESLETLLGLDTTKIPKSFTSIKILGDSIPLGVMLAYYMGIKNLAAITRTKMTVHPPRAQVTPTDKNTVVLKFSDAKVVFECPTHSAALLFAGFTYYKNYTKTQTLESFYSPNVYLDLLESRGAGLLHLKEMEMLKDNFIDPITKDALEATGEPTQFLPLMLRANQLLEDFHHPDVNDPAISRIRGYDRVPGLVYRALTEAVRTQRMKGGRGKIELDPYKVWKYVTQDTTVKVVEDSNPITDTKEVESVTFSGLDGLSRTATPEKLRKYHQKDAGLISEATVDSTDVALNLYLSPYAKVKSLLGDVDVESTEHKEHPEKIFSTSMQLAPFSEYDDPKRIN